MPEECKPEEPLAKVERKVAGSIPTDDEVFSAISFEARDNGDIVTCLLSLGCVQIFVIVAI